MQLTFGDAEDRLGHLRGDLTRQVTVDSSQEQGRDQRAGTDAGCRNRGSYLAGERPPSPFSLAKSRLSSWRLASSRAVLLLHCLHAHGGHGGEQSQADSCIDVGDAAVLNFHHAIPCSRWRKGIDRPDALAGHDVLPTDYSVIQERSAGI
jgi:hypothetical protein